jgi:hypothetical protein
MVEKQGAHRMQLEQAALKGENQRANWGMGMFLGLMGSPNRLPIVKLELTE